MSSAVSDIPGTMNIHQLITICRTFATSFAFVYGLLAIVAIFNCLISVVAYVSEMLNEARLRSGPRPNLRGRTEHYISLHNY